jgi:two-component system nitrate/nitrite response regulator NarL
MSNDTNIGIVSKSEILREGLRRVLTDNQFVVAGAASDSTALVSMLSGKPPPDLIIIEVAAGSSDLENCRQLRETFGSSRLVLLAEDYSIESTLRAMSVGIDGYLTKEISCAPLVGALRLVVLGEKVMPSQTVEALSATHWQPASGHWLANTNDVRLSEREVEILCCLTRGDANKLISRQLVITEATVKVHIKTILRKLSVMNRTQAAMWAVSHGFNAGEISAHG